MDVVETIFRLLREYGTVTATLGATVVFLWSVIQFFLVRRRNAANRDFEAYHRLIKELVQPDPGASTPYMDRQAAVVFELRHFPKYYEFSLRTLSHLREAWKKPDSPRSRVSDEIDLTIGFLEAQMKRRA